MKLPIYLDYAATTPIDERVLKKMQECCCLEGCFGNPASTTHQYGRDAKQLVETARQQVAALVNVKSQEIIFTSGATESDNLAIKGIAYAYQSKGKHIITCKTEHKAVLDSCKFLEKNGFRVTYLPVMNNGLVNLDDLNKAITAETILVSIMHVNNETGVIQDINAIGNICREKNIIFHVDAAQSAGKLVIDLQKLPVDLMSFSAHKAYGPKGIGALYVKSQVKLEPLIHGGGHENGMRSGTLATQQIVGMGEAFHIAKEDMLEDAIRIKNLRQKLWHGISVLEGIHINGDLHSRSDTHLNIRVDYIDGGAILMALADLAISMGSACNSSSIEPSFVLRAMGLTDEQAHASIRMSIGRFTTDEEIDFTIHHFKEGIEWLRSMSPLWLERANGGI